VDEREYDLKVERLTWINHMVREMMQVEEIEVHAIMGDVWRMDAESIARRQQELREQMRLHGTIWKSYLDQKPKRRELVAECERRAELFVKAERTIHNLLDVRVALDRVTRTLAELENSKV